VIPLAGELRIPAFMVTWLHAGKFNFQSLHFIRHKGTSRLVEDLFSIQNLMRWIDIEFEHHRYENFRSSLSAYLESCHVFSQEEKLMCSQKLLIEIEEEQEQYELLVKYEHYRGGYEAAMAALHKYYGFKLKTNNVVLPEKKFLDIYSNQNEEFAQSIFVERTCSDIYDYSSLVERCP
jgi:hypothetical protein